MKKFAILLCLLLFPSVTRGLDLFGGGAAREIRRARGTATELDVRLDESMNEDGSLKGDVTISEWISGYAATYEAGTQFKVGGDHTAVYRAGRRMYLICTNTANNVYMTCCGSAYSGTQTTVSSCASGVPADINRGDYSVVSRRSTPPPAEYTNTEPTANLITGRLWFDSDNELLRVYYGAWYAANGQEGVYNVNNFAVGSVTDGIQEAVDAAYAAGGGTVWLAAGDYTCDKTVTLYSNIIIEGDGWDTIVASSSATDVDLDLATGMNARGLETITLQSDIIDCSTSANAGTVSAGDVIWLRDNTITTESVSAYVVTDSNATTGTVTLDAEVFTPYPTTPQMIVPTSRVSNVVIKDIYFKSVYPDLAYADNITVSNCRFDDITTAGVIMDFSYDITLKDNMFYNMPNGITVNSSSSVLLDGNVFSHISTDSIKLNESTLVRVVNNEGKSSGAYTGIYLVETDFSSLVGNAMNSKGATDCIWLDEYSDSNSAVGNICPYAIIDNDGADNRGAGNVWLTCEGCSW